MGKLKKRIIAYAERARIRLLLCVREFISCTSNCALWLWPHHQQWQESARDFKTFHRAPRVRRVLAFAFWNDINHDHRRWKLYGAELIRSPSFAVLQKFARKICWSPYTGYGTVRFFRMRLHLPASHVGRSFTRIAWSRDQREITF